MHPMYGEWRDYLSYVSTLSDHFGVMTNYFDNSGWIGVSLRVYAT